MHQCSGSPLVQIMAWCRTGNKPLPETMLANCQWDSWEQISVKFESEFYYFHSRKCFWNCRLPQWQPFCPGRDELTFQPTLFDIHLVPRHLLHCDDQVWAQGGHFKNTYELLNLRALKFSPVNKIYIFQSMGMIFRVEFQRCPLKFRAKYLTQTLKDMTFIQHWNFKSS